MSRPTIIDVAEKCGLSKATVSKALNSGPGSALVSDQTRARVHKVAEELGYRASWKARVLTRRRSQMVGVVFSAPKAAVPRSVYWEVADRLEERLEELGYSLTFVHAQEADDRLKQMLGDGRFDGVISLGMIAEPVLELMERSGLPAVLINPGPSEGWARVALNDAQGMRLAMSHLLAQGHARIAYRGPRAPMAHPSTAARYGTYAACMREAGLTPAPEFTGTTEQFVAELFASPDRPTAIVDFEHWTAIQLLQQLWRRGARVPDDFSVVTFNDAHPVADVIPPLTTVALPGRAMADRAVEMLMARVEDDDAGENVAPETVVLEESLVVRESTAPVRSR